MRSISIPQLYSSWFKALGQYLPEETPNSRIMNFVFLITGIFQARSPHLSRIAGKIPIRAKKRSLIKRMERLANNPAVNSRRWYKPIAQQLITAASVTGQLHLVMDCSKVSSSHQLLMVALAYNGRALPLVWTWVPHKRGHSRVRQQVALLKYVQKLIPSGIAVSLVGDSEFGHTPVIDRLEQWGWDYALRQSGRHLVRITGDQHWKRLDTLVRRGELVWLGHYSYPHCQDHRLAKLSSEN